MRKDKKAFLASLTDAKRTLVQPGPQSKQRQAGRDANADNTAASADRAARRLQEHAKRLEGLRTGDYCIQDVDGNVCELVDIGINVGKLSHPEMLHWFERSLACGVTRLLLTGTSLKSSRQALKTCERWHAPGGGFEKTPVRLYATVGVHPHDASSLVGAGAGAGAGGVLPERLQELRALATHPSAVSLGECGLDYDRMFSPRDAQQRAFAAQVALAVETRRPLFVHLRDRDVDKGPALGAVQDAMATLDAHCVDPAKVVVHCFTGSAADLATLTAKGFYVGLTGFVGNPERCAATGTTAALRDRALLAPERLLLETDAPYMKPKRLWLPPATGLHKARGNEPSALPAVCRALASVFWDGHHSPSDLARVTTANAVRLFALDEVDALRETAGTTVTNAVPAPAAPPAASPDVI